MGVRQPAEVIRDLAVGPRPDDEVPVIREDTVRQDPQGMPAMGLDSDPAESLRRNTDAASCFLRHRIPWVCASQRK
jgi:hypothetical protein